MSRKRRHVYTFENRCIQEPGLGLGDDAVKIILNTKGTEDDVSQDMKKLLDFIDGRGAGDSFTKELEEAVKTVRENEKWRLGYMTLQMSYQEKFEEGLEQGLERGLEQGKREAAIKMIEEGGLSLEKIALYTGLDIKQVRELQKNMQPV